MRQALAGPAVGQAVLRVRRPPLAARARRQPVGPERARDVRNVAVVPHGRRRRHLDAGQVGVPVVRGVGPGLPLRAAVARRRRLRQGAGRAAARARATCTPTARSRPTSGTSATSTRRCTAWAALCVYEREAEIRGEGDREFLARVFQRLLTNFTWWVNRKDPDGRNLFQGGFLGLDNIGIFDRSAPLPGGGTLEQADGTAWMALYCQWMLQIAVELARERPGLRRHRAEVRRALRVDRDRARPAGRRHAAVGRGGRLLLRRHADARRRRRSRSRCARSSACCRCARRPCSTPTSLDAPPGAHRARAGVRRALRRRGARRSPTCPGPSPEGRRLLALVDEAQLRRILDGDARRGRVPRPARDPRDLAPPPRRTRACSTGAASTTRSATCRPSPTPACSAATRTGAGRSGSR